METLEDLIKDKSTYLEQIKTPSVHDFTVEAIKTYGDAEKFHEAAKVICVLEAILTKMKQMNENSRPVWVEVLVSAAYLHNLFYDGSLPSIFEAREKLSPIAQKYEVPINATSLIFQAIEGQLGADMPVESCQPQGDSPNSKFAWACWYVEELNGVKPMPECRELK